ncbi:holo-ACP synthase [Catenovulum maritimum]|uniref:Holo-[acyl-carrier-protein] synthase n=1 Tax=Catenovulum maritimum TaxID=1513271 RepID=A0A0J8GUB5_9ALTE|nr:holo-ACP synthase [Catenovulum maritimum]KMT64283.1 ACP synthase [Catenovulum maritimum]
MILGLGNDIVEIKRFDNANLLALAKRVLTPNELNIFGEHKQAIAYLAKRWAAKEAAAKAVGTGIACGVSFQNFEITNDERGKPVLLVSGQAEKILSDLAQGKVVKSLISLSDEQSYAFATVIFESS